MTITAIIPALNEEISIGSVVIKTKSYVDRVIVVDDGSSDNTAKIARIAGAEVIEHHHNKGKGEALRTGFLAAAQNDVNIIVTIDADGQHDPDDIPKLINPILEKQADLVIGSRYLNGNRIPKYRQVGQRILDHFTNLNSGIKATDTQSGYRAFAICTIPSFKFRQNGFSIESEMLADAVEAGFKIKEVDVGVRYDVDCNTMNPFHHGLKVLLDLLKDMEFKRPLYYFTIPGFVISTIGLSMGLIFLENFHNGESLYFGPALLMILLLLIGVMTIFSGIILHTISRTINRDK